MSIITRRAIFFIFLISLSFLFACSKPETSAPTENSTANTNSPSGAAVNPNATPTTEVEPVMPEKVQVAFEQNCKNCHGPDGHGINGVGSDLRKAAKRTSVEWIKYLRDEAGKHSSQKIPAMTSLTEKDYEEISGYLADLTQNNVPAAGAKK